MTEIKADIDFAQLMSDVACIKQAVMGNGVTGLCERVNNLEKCQNNHYKITGVFSGLGVVLGSVITFLVQIFKG